MLASVYCNSLLATLNSRQFVLSRGLTKRERKRLEADPEGADPESQRVSLSANRRSEAERGGTSTPSARAVFTSMLEPPFLTTFEVEEEDFRRTESERSLDERMTDQERTPGQVQERTTQQRQRPSLSRDNYRREDLNISASELRNPSMPPGIETQSHTINFESSDDPEKLSPGSNDTMTPMSMDSTKKFGQL